MSKIIIGKEEELKIVITCQNESDRDRFYKQLMKGKKYMEKFI